MILDDRGSNPELKMWGGKCEIEKVWGWKCEINLHLVRINLFVYLWSSLQLPHKKDKHDESLKNRQQGQKYNK